MFAYLYYRIFSIYKYKWNESIPGVYAICVVTTLQFFNISCLIYLAYFIAKVHLNINKFDIVILDVILLCLNYYRFHVHSNFGSLEKRWKNEAKQKKTTKGVLIIIYIVFSVFMILLLANYLGGINRKL